MKSFSQFLQESYLNEEEARQGSLMTRSGKPQDFRNPKKVPFTATDPTPTPASRRLSAASSDAPKTPSGQLQIPEPKTTKVPGKKFRNAGEARQGLLLTKSGGAQDFTKAGKGRVPFTSSEPVTATKRFSAGASEAPKVSPGQMDINFNAKPNRGGDMVTYSAPPKPTAPASAQSAPPKPAAIVKASPSTPSTRPTSSSSIDIPQKPVKVVDLDSQRRRDAKAKLKSAAAGTGPSGKPIITPPPKVQEPSSSGTKGKMPTGAKPTGKFAKALKVLGPVGTAADVAFSTADERAKGSGWARSLAKGATVAAGGLLGGAAGAIGGGGIGSAALGTAGAIGGAQLAGKAFDVAAGANAKERAAMATANRQRQAGTAIKGIGGKTTFDTKKNTMTTGTGSQRKTVGLAKTGVVQRGGQSVAGHLAYRGGKAVYKAGPSAQSLAKTSSNPLERIGRTMFAGAYKKHDAAKAQQALTKARQSDMARQKALGVKALPGK
jgi:hypothetical protein